MSTESHTGKCKQNRSRYYERKAAFITTWKDYCRTCKGTGGKWVKDDPSPAGVGLSPGYLDTFVECPDCIDLNKCPRCGERILVSKYADISECTICGWDLEEAELDYSGEYRMPEEPECYCYPRDDTDIVEEELAIRTELEIDVANDPERRARQDEVDDALVFILGSDDRDDEGDDYRNG